MAGRPGANNMRRLSDGLAAFLKKNAPASGPGLNNLWADWINVYGQGIGQLARPLGHKDNTLILGVDDSIAMQELSMYADNILDKANAYLGRTAFTALRLELQDGRIPLDAQTQTPRPARKKNKPAPRPAPPDGLQGRAEIPADSAVGKCYAAYLRLFGLAGKNRK